MPINVNASLTQPPPSPASPASPASTHLREALDLASRPDRPALQPHGADEVASLEQMRNCLLHGKSVDRKTLLKDMSRVVNGLDLALRAADRINKEEIAQLPVNSSDLFEAFNEYVLGLEFTSALALKVDDALSSLEDIDSDDEVDVVGYEADVEDRETESEPDTELDSTTDSKIDSDTPLNDRMDVGLEIGPVDDDKGYDADDESETSTETRPASIQSNEDAPARNRCADIGRRFMASIRYVTQNQVQSHGAAEAIGVGLLTVRNVLLLGCTSWLQSATASLAESLLRDDGSDPEGKQMRIAVASVVSLLVPVALMTAGWVADKRNGTLTNGSIAGQGTLVLMQGIGQAAAIKSGNMGALAANVLAIGTTNVLGQILGEIVKVQSATIATRNGLALAAHVDSATVASISNMLLSGGVTFSSDFAGVKDLPDRKVNQHGATLPSNALMNATFQVVGHTAFSFIKKIACDWYYDKVSRVQIVIRWPTAAQLCEVSTKDLAVTMLMAQNNNLFASVASAIPQHWLAKIAASAAASAGTGAIQAVAGLYINSTSSSDEPIPGASATPPDERTHLLAGNETDSNAPPVDPNSPSVSVRMEPRSGASGREAQMQLLSTPVIESFSHFDTLHSNRSAGQRARPPSGPATPRPNTDLPSPQGLPLTDQNLYGEGTSSQYGAVHSHGTSDTVIPMDDSRIGAAKPTESDPWLSFLKNSSRDYRSRYGL